MLKLAEARPLKEKKDAPGFAKFDRKSGAVEMAKFAEFMQMFAVVKFKARYL